MRDNPSYSSFLRIDMLALSLGKLPIPVMTVTENVDTFLDYPEELRLFTKVPHYIRKGLRSLYRSIF